MMWNFIKTHSIQMKTKEIKEINLSDYEPSHSIFSEDDPRTTLLKEIIHNYLTENERKIFLLYTECDGSYSKMAEYIRYDSRKNMYIYISSIKKKIKQYYDELSSNS